jgi:hypothetical protein
MTMNDSSQRLSSAISPKNPSMDSEACILRREDSGGAKSVAK